MEKIKNIKYEQFTDSVIGYDWIITIKADDKDIECWIQLKDYDVSYKAYGFWLRDYKKDKNILLNALYENYYYFYDYIKRYAPELAD